MASNVSISHDFFYSGFNKTRCLQSVSVWYKDNFFLSYNTIIGLVTKDKNNNDVLLLSNCNFSQTTSRHIQHLRSACPFDVYRVPFEYGNNWDSVGRVANRFIEHLKYYAKQKMTLAKNRDEFIEFYRYALQFSEYVQTIEGLEEYRALYDTLRDDEKVKELKAKQRKEDAEKRKQAKKELETLLKNTPYLDMVKFAFTFNTDNAKVIRKVLNPNNDYSLAFVWLDNGEYRTSKGIRMSKTVGDIALNAWKNGALKIGDKLGQFTVLKITNEFVKIGCHTIPVENLKALTA